MPNFVPASPTAWLLRQAFQAMETEKGRRLRPTGLRAAHYSLLATVSSRPGLSGAALARSLGVSPQNIATLVVRLETQDLLERRSTGRDDHVREIHLTPRGEVAVAEADREVGGMESDIVAHFDADDLEQLHRLIRQLAAVLDRPATLPPSPEPEYPVGD
jgi:DNA-binding MarR family transcriptional regulator